MAKIAILGDLHLGIKKDDDWIIKNQMSFFEFFFKTCKDNGVTDIIQTGDWFDVRYGITQKTMNIIREKIIPGFQDIGETFVIVGNHDMHKREMIQPNSCTEILGFYDKFTVFDTPQTRIFDGVAIDFIPWICRENDEFIQKYIAESTSDYCVGHFSLKGYYYYTGLQSEGSDAGFLNGYKQVWSGHFHCQSSGGNVKYVGTPYTLTLGDANDDRGFHIFDTDTKTLTFYKNPTTNHQKIYFDADTFDPSIIDKFSDIALRIIVENRNSETRKIDFDVVIERFASVVHSLDILENFDSALNFGDSDVSLEKEKTQEFVKRYIDELDEPDNIKKRITNIFNALYTEAINMD